jgi:hypothetical protein
MPFHDVEMKPDTDPTDLRHDLFDSFAVAAPLTRIDVLVRTPFVAATRIPRLKPRLNPKSSAWTTTKAIVSLSKDGGDWGGVKVGDRFTRLTQSTAIQFDRFGYVTDRRSLGESAQTLSHLLEPIREVLESDESDVIHCWALDSLESARCGSLNTALRRTAVAFVTRAI